MYQSIEEAYEARITKKQAIEFLKEHGYELSDFIADCGDKPEYLGKVILDWAGY